MFSTQTDATKVTRKTTSYTSKFGYNHCCGWSAPRPFNNVEWNELGLCKSSHHAPCYLIWSPKCCITQQIKNGNMVFSIGFPQEFSLPITIQIDSVWGYNNVAMMLAHRNLGTSSTDSMLHLFGLLDYRSVYWTQHSCWSNNSPSSTSSLFYFFLCNSVGILWNMITLLELDCRTVYSGTSTCNIYS